MNGNLNYLTRSCEWECREKRIIKISQPSWLLEKSDSKGTREKNLSVFNKECNDDESINLTCLSNPHCMRGIKNSQKQSSIIKYSNDSKKCMNTKLNKGKTNSLDTISLDSGSFNKQKKFSSTNKHGKKPYAYFDINMALQLSTQNSGGSSSRYKTTRKISEYFSLQKCINKKSPHKSSNWISLNLFEQKSISKQLEVEKSTFLGAVPSTTEKFHSDNNITSISEMNQNHDPFTKMTHLPENILKTDWVSRGLKASANKNELDISAIELFLTQDFLNNRKAGYSSTQILCSNDSATSKRKSNGIKSASRNKKSNQSNLYQYFRKYGKSVVEKKKIDNVGNLHYITNKEHSDHFCKKVKNCKWKGNISVQFEKRNGHACYMSDTPEHNYVVKLPSRKSEDLKETSPHLNIFHQTSCQDFTPSENSFDIIPEHNSNLSKHGDIEKEIVYHELYETSLGSSCFQMSIDEKESSNSYEMKIDAVTNNLEKNISNNPQIHKVNNFTTNDVLDNINILSHNLVIEFQKSVTKTEKHNGHACYISDTPEPNYVVKSPSRKSEYLNETSPHINIFPQTSCQGFIQSGNSFGTIPEHNSNLSKHGDIEKKIVYHELYESSLASSCFQMNIDERESTNSYAMKIDAVTDNLEKNIPNNPQIHEVTNFTTNDVLDNINIISHDSVLEFQKSVTITACELLECVSSPIITEPEIQEYLKELICDQQKTSQNITECFGTSTGEADKNQDYSPRQANSTIELVPQRTSERCHPDGDKFDNGSEIFQYILSKECVDSNMLMNNALKSMGNLSQEIMKKRSIIFDNNMNSNEILGIALKIYAQYKEISILSEAKGSTHNSLMKFNVIKESEDCICIYKIIQNSYVGHDKANINMFALWNDRVSLRSISEINQKILSGLEEMCKNDSFLYVEAEDGPCFSARTSFNIENKIKDIFEEVLKNLDGQKSPYLEIRRQTFEDCTIVNSRLELKTEENPKMIQVKYNSSSSQTKFCLIMYILAKVLQLQATNSKTTRRELYYQIKHLISNQSYIDRAVKAVSRMFCVGPWDLNIVAHKGMVYGNLKIVMSSKEVIDCNLPGTLIPQDVDDIVELRSSAFFILVVEKESIFYKLLEEDLPNKLVRPFIMITGKGFPDLNTSLFLRKLWMVMTIPVLIFTDSDPHGVNIMTSYRFGSLANAHLSRNLAIPKAQWLGVFPSEIVKLNADKQALTQSERGFLQNMLKSPCTKINMNIEKELKFMLESGYKAGIEGIIKNNNFLSEYYFPLKFHNKDFI